MTGRGTTSLELPKTKAYIRRKQQGQLQGLEVERQYREQAPRELLN